MKVSVLESTIKISTKKWSTRSWKLDVVLQIFMRQKNLEEGTSDLYRDIIL